MSANLSGNNINSGDFQIKTCVADLEAGYAKEKFRAKSGGGVVIDEVDGEKGKCLEFSADMSGLSVGAKLVAGANIELDNLSQSPKTVISSPDVGKVLVNSTDTPGYLEAKFKSTDNSVSHNTNNGQIDLKVENLGKVKYNGELLDLTDGQGISLTQSGTTLEVAANLNQGSGITITNNVGGSKTISATNNGKVFVNSSDANADFLNNKINCIFPLQKSVFNNSELQIRVWDKLNFAQYNEKWNGGVYDKSDISGYYNKTAILGKIYCDNADLFGVCFVVIQGDPLTLHIRYTATSDVGCILYYRIIGDINWESQSVTLNNSSGKASEISLNIPNIGDAPMEFLLVCEEDMGNNIARIFEIYAD